MFANNYLSKNNRLPLIKSEPDKDCEIIIVIPCFREPDVLDTLDSLEECISPGKKFEVIVLINHSETAAEEIKDFNFKTKESIGKWIKHTDRKGRYFVVGPVDLPKKWAGVGLARKTGMDEALQRFNLLEKPDGIIVSLDADTLVAQNYLVEIENYFKSNPKNIGATISFQHQTRGLEAKQLQGILLYEKYLLYYKKALEYIGYPNPLYTIGSAFAVTAGGYMKRGGMTRRQAGEDFYFLQTLTQIGRVGEISTTCVFPSARTSDRIPFGTGPAIAKWMSGEVDLRKTYNFQAFVDLKAFFDFREKLFKLDQSTYLRMILELPESVQKFLLIDNFWNEIDDLNANCSNYQTFQTRFFHKFNAFKILKFINFTHEKYYDKVDLNDQMQLLSDIKK